MKNLVVNARGAFFAVLSIALIALGVWTISDDTAISVCIIALGALLLFIYALAFPAFCVINSDGVAVYFLLGAVKKKASFESLKIVEDHHSRFGALPWWREYHFAYFKTRFPLWERACIPKTVKSQRLIEKYYGKAEKVD